MIAGAAMALAAPSAAQDVAYESGLSWEAFRDFAGRTLDAQG